MPNIAADALPNPTSRGYHAVYRSDIVNHCPGCGRTHWYVGRLLAECCFCATALPLENSTMGWGRIVQPLQEIDSTLDANLELAAA